MEDKKKTKEQLIKELSSLRGKVAGIEGSSGCGSVGIAADNNEAAYRTLVENIPQKIFYKDINSVYVMANTIFADDLGLTPDNIVGKTDFDFFPENLANKYRTDDVRIMSSSAAEELEEYYFYRGEIKTIRTLKGPVRDGKGNIIGVFGIFSDVTGHKRIKEVLTRHELLSGHSRDIIFLLRRDDGRILEANSAALRTYGYTRDEFLGLHITDVRSVETRDAVSREMTAADETGILFETRHRRKDGSTFPVEVSSQGATIEDERMLISVVRDITDRRQAEEERVVSVGFLTIINESSNRTDLIQKLTAFIQLKSGCEAAGIRLKDGDDYPYYQTSGFSRDFVLMENTLCSRDDSGAVVRDEVGNPVIQCMCGNVITACFDPSKPFFTERGSFWTNCTTKLLAETSEADRQARTRNRCNGEGYESVALIALKFGDQRLGLSTQ